MTKPVERDEAIHLLADGEVVALPTDTVYGVAATLEDAEAVARVFLLKGRPTTVALPVLVGAMSEVESIGVLVPLAAQRLAKALWPGAVTIVLAAPKELALRVGASDTVGFRVPNDDLLLSVLRETGPLVVSSANEHGQAPCHSAEEVVASLGSSGLLSAVLDDGPRNGEVSTVVEVVGESWRVLRAGAISADAIARVLERESLA